MNKLKKTITHLTRKLGMDKDLNARLVEIEREYKKETESSKDCQLSDFLNLLNLAEYGYLGKTKAIFFAYKLGYQHGRKEVLEDEQ